MQDLHARTQARKARAVDRRITRSGARGIRGQAWIGQQDLQRRGKDPARKLGFAVAGCPGHRHGARGRGQRRIGIGSGLRLVHDARERGDSRKVASQAVGKGRPHGICRPPDFGGKWRDRTAPDKMIAVIRRKIGAEIVGETAPLAAQPLVRLSYVDPVGTFGSNVMGTVHLLDAVRRLSRPQAILVVTSDKVYANDGSGRAYSESDPLGGHDPYSASKAATEIVAASFRDAYFTPAGQPLATARGGNVIGGGDYSGDRLVPDIVRALSRNEAVALRNPGATRPWQHVLDCLDGYFTYLQAMALGRNLPPALNFGPLVGSPSFTVAALTDALLKAMGRPAAHQLDPDRGPHEMATLSIDPGLAGTVLPWRPRLNPDAMLRLTAEWYAAQAAGQDIAALTDAQIAQYQDLAS